MMRRLVLACLIPVMALPVLPASAQDPTTVSITPDSALEDGDLVTVTGSGFEPGSDVFLLLCNDDTRLGDTLGRCALIGAGATGYVVQPSGTFSAPNVVVPVGQVGATGLATCPPSAAQLARGVSCSIQVSNQALEQVAGATIGYVDQPIVDAAELAFTGPRQGALVWVAVALIVFGATAHTGGWIWERRRRMSEARPNHL